MASGQAFANETVFKLDPTNYLAKSLRPCTNAAENGIELDTNKLDDETVIKRWLYAEKIYILAVMSLGDDNNPEIIARCVFMSPE